MDFDDKTVPIPTFSISTGPVSTASYSPDDPSAKTLVSASIMVLISLQLKYKMKTLISVESL